MTEFIQALLIVALSIVAIVAMVIGYNINVKNKTTTDQNDNDESLSELAMTKDDKEKN